MSNHIMVLERILTCFLVVFMLCCAFACQPVPEKSAVLQLDDSEATDVISDFASYPTSVRLDEKSLGCGSVSFDATMEIPSIDACSIFQVRQALFTNEDLQNMIDILKPDAVLYKSWDKTKQELLELRISFEEIAGDSELDRMYLEWLTSAFETAPVDIEKTVFDWNSLRKDDSVFVYADDGGSVVASFQLSADTFAYFKDISLDQMPVSWVMQDDPLIISEPVIERNTAYNKAIDVLAALGANDMVAVSNAESKVVEYRQNRTTEVGYSFIFVPQYQKLRHVYDDSVAIKEESLPSVAAPWSPEYIQIVVDSEGISQLIWDSPTAKDTELESEVKFVPIDRILERAQQQLLNMFAVAPDYVDADTGEILQSIVVTKIELVRGCIQQRDHLDVGQSVPLWEFTYTYRWQDRTETEQNAIYINAVDGSYVEPRVTMYQIMEQYGDND